MIRLKNKTQSGAVSLFVVIFTALLITIVTVGFMRLMVRDQKQATDNDLSQSAYDSAMSGVEDGKRAILKYYQECVPSTEATGCTQPILKSVSSTDCLGALAGLGLTSDGKEIKLQTNNNDKNLDQAYTCVKITLDTADYLGKLAKDDNKFIRLKSKNNASFKKVKLDWFSAKDISSGTIKIPSFSAVPLLDDDEWGNRPSIMRAQLVQFTDGNISVSSFDDNTLSGSNSSTIFLYPTNITSTTYDFPSGTRRVSSLDDTDYLKMAHCETGFSIGGYACSVTLNLPDPIGGGAENRVAYLNLTALYSGTNYRLTLLDGSDGIVFFDGIQPEIDSTGRANDLFRRVKSRVEMIDSNFPYPKAAVDLTDSLCKTFTVTSQTYNPGDCNY